MIFRNSKGELIDINIYNCKNDKIFYTKIMDLKTALPKCNESTNHLNYSNSVIRETIQ